MPSSKKCEPASTSFAMRSRAVSRPFLCCDSMAFAPPPTDICSSSFLTCVTKSTTLRLFLANSGDLVFTLLFRTEEGTREPSQRTYSELQPSCKEQSPTANASVYGFKKDCASYSGNNHRLTAFDKHYRVCPIGGLQHRIFHLEAPVTTLVEVVGAGCAFSDLIYIA